MDCQQLREILRSKGVPEDAYDLGGGHQSEAYTLQDIGRRWVFYYSERGLESGKITFSSESDACEYMLEVLAKEFGFKAD